MHTIDIPFTASQQAFAAILPHLPTGRDTGSVERSIRAVQLHTDGHLVGTNKYVAAQIKVANLSVDGDAPLATLLPKEAAEWVAALNPKTLRRHPVDYIVSFLFDGPDVTVSLLVALKAERSQSFDYDSSLNVPPVRRLLDGFTPAEDAYQVDLLPKYLLPVIAWSKSSRPNDALTFQLGTPTAFGKPTPIMVTSRDDFWALVQPKAAK